MSNKLLYYKSADNWNEALPLGNGSIGAMVYGGSDLEMIQLNKDTFWSGNALREERCIKHKELAQIRKQIFNEDYAAAQETAKGFQHHDSAAYLPVGTLYIRHIGRNNRQEYKRELLLDSAEINVTCKNEKYSDEAMAQLEIKRNYFISYPHDVMVIRISSNGKKEVSFSLFGESDVSHSVTTEPNMLKISGSAPETVYRDDGGKEKLPFVHGENTVSFQISARVVVEDGLVEQTGNKLNVYHAQSAVILVAVKTDFVSFDTIPDQTIDLHGLCAKTIEAALEQGVDEVYRQHVEDYRRLYERVFLRLTGKEPEQKSGDKAFEARMDEMPTDRRLAMFMGNAEDLGLIETMFNFGRYLMISGSRKGTQAMNLQGIWSNYIQPPWNCNYTTNINTEMNYWPAEVCNLAECHMPLLQMIEELSIAGENTAHDFYNASGFAVHHNTDLWRKTTPSSGSARWALWPMAGGWLCRHLWEHYEFSGDREFLVSKAYPTTRKAGLFYVDFLIRDEQGYYVTCPSTSPENAFLAEDSECYVTKASTMDICIIRELFTNFISICDLLDINDPLLDRVKEMLPVLYPFHTGSRGQLLEYDREFEETDQGHRHLSHLYGLYPGNQIHPMTPALFTAARRSLEIRLENGGGHTGWSCGWIICLFARLLDGEMAGQYIRTLLQRSAYSNLFDAHPPFQIDGNFSFTAGVAEMLLQSRRENGIYVLHILPAKPPSWKEGEVRGLRARGGFEVDIKWNGNNEPEVKVKNNNGNQYSLIK